MLKEQELELVEFIETIKQLDSLQFTLMQNSADTLLAMERLEREKDKWLIDVNE